MAGTMIELNYTLIGIVAIICMIVVALLVWLYSYYSDIKDNYPELAVHKAAKHKPHPPIIDLVDNSGRHMQFSGVKDKPYSLTLKDESYGLYFDPGLAGRMPADHLLDGTKIYFYGTTFHFPVDTLGARAVVQLLQNIRTEFPQLGFIRDDFAIMEMLQKSNQDIQYDLNILLSAYKQDTKDGEEDLTIEDLCSIIEEIKIKMKEWKVTSGFFTIQDAVNKLPLGMTAMDMKKAVALAKAEERNDMKHDNMNQYLPLYIVGGLIAIIVVVYMVTK